MTKPIQNSALYTSLDYHNALKATDKIKRAVSLIEGGDAVVDFSRYVKAYTELVEKLVATNDQGNDTNSKMEVAHNKLSKELQGLERRIVAASAKIGVTPPSKDLMQILKINVMPAEEKPTQKLTWTQTAKYSAYLSAGGLSAYAFYKFYDSIQKLPETIKRNIFEDESIRQFQETFKKTVLENEFLKQIPGKLPGATKTVIKETVKAGTKAMTVLDNSIKAANTYVTGLGQVANKGREVLKSITGIEVPPGDPTEQGFSFLVNLGVARYIWGIAKPYVMPFLGPMGPILPIDMAIDGAIVCNTLHPNCTSSIIDTANATVHFAKDHPTELYALGTVVVPSIGIYHRDIADAFNSAKGSKLESMAYFGFGKYLATQAIDSAYPGLIANYSNEYPLVAKVSDWGGTLGSVAGPWIASYSGMAKAWGQAATNAISLPPRGSPRSSLRAVNKARTAAFANGYQKAFTVTSIALGFLGTVLPPTITIMSNLAYDTFG